MKYLFFDTETTGLPKNHGPASKFEDVWPFPVSIAWILADEGGVILNSEYHLIKPEAWDIPPESIAIHKITPSMAMQHGISCRTVMERFLWYVGSCDVIVAHNLHFDQNVINNVLKWRLGKSMMLEDYKKRMFCTMSNGRDIVGMPGKTPGKFKNAKLSEMYKQTFGTEPTGTLHNAMTDTTILMQCFFRIWGTLEIDNNAVTVDFDLPAKNYNLINATASAPVITTLTISLTDPSDAV